MQNDFSAPINPRPRRPLSVPRQALPPRAALRPQGRNWDMLRVPDNQPAVPAPPSLPPTPVPHISAKPAVRRTPAVPSKTVHHRQNRSNVLHRHVVQKSATAIKKQARARRYVREAQILLVLAAVVFICGMVSSVTLFQRSRSLSHVAVSKADLYNESSDGGNGLVGTVPKEKIPPLDAYKSYTVANDQPRYIAINAIGVTARVKPLGGSVSSQIAMTNNIYDAGWYTASAKPGTNGKALVLTAYESGPTQPGLFQGLAALKTGMLVKIITGGNKSIIYKIATIQTSTPERMQADALLAGDPTKGALTLVIQNRDSTAQEPSFTLVKAVQQ